MLRVRSLTFRCLPFSQNLASMSCWTLRTVASLATPAARLQFGDPRSSVSLTLLRNTPRGRGAWGSQAKSIRRDPRGRVGSGTGMIPRCTTRAGNLKQLRGVPCATDNDVARLSSSISASSPKFLSQRSFGSSSSSPSAGSISVSSGGNRDSDHHVLSNGILSRSG